MKKIDFKSVIIGCLVMTCMFLFIGQTNQIGHFDKIYAKEIFINKGEDNFVTIKGRGIKCFDIKNNLESYVSPGEISIVDNESKNETTIAPSEISIVDNKSKEGTTIISYGVVGMNIGTNEKSFELFINDNNHGALWLYEENDKVYFSLPKYNRY